MGLGLNVRVGSIPPILTIFGRKLDENSVIKNAHWGFQKNDETRTGGRGVWTLTLLRVDGSGLGGLVHDIKRPKKKPNEPNKV